MAEYKKFDLNNEQDRQFYESMMALRDDGSVKAPDYKEITKHEESHQAMLDLYERMLFWDKIKEKYAKMGYELESELLLSAALKRDKFDPKHPDSNDKLLFLKSEMDRKERWSFNGFASKEDILKSQMLTEESFNLLKEKFKDDYKEFNSELKSNYKDKNQGIIAKMGEIFSDESSRKSLLKFTTNTLKAAAFTANPALFAAVQGAMYISKTKPMKKLGNFLSNRVKSYFKDSAAMELLNEHPKTKKFLKVTALATGVIGGSLLLGDVVDSDALMDSVGDAFNDMREINDGGTSDNPFDVEVEDNEKIIPEVNNDSTKISEDALKEGDLEELPDYDIDFSDYKFDDFKADLTTDPLLDSNELSFKSELLNNTSELPEGITNGFDNSSLMENSTSQDDIDLPNKDFAVDINKFLQLKGDELSYSSENLELNETLEISNEDTSFDLSDKTMTEYQIEKGDTLSSILEKIDGETYDLNGANMQDAIRIIAEHNGISNPDMIMAGTTIEIPNSIENLQAMVENTTPVDGNAETLLADSQSEVQKETEITNSNPENVEPVLNQETMLGSAREIAMLSLDQIDSLDMDKFLDATGVESDKLHAAIQQNIEKQIQEGIFPTTISIDGTSPVSGKVEGNLVISKDLLASSLTDVKQVFADVVASNPDKADLYYETNTQDVAQSNTEGVKNTKPKFKP